MLDRLLQRAVCRYSLGFDSTASALLDCPLQLAAWEQTTLLGCVGVGVINRLAARIEIVAVRYREDVGRTLDALLPPLEERARKRGSQTLVFFGQENWLISVLEQRGFERTDSILLLRKRGWGVPGRGNNRVRIRAATPQDIPPMVCLDGSAFEDVVWRSTPDTLHQCLDRMPHFVVAQWEGRVVGYQYSDVREEDGYLARVVVHPEAQGRQIGTRLVAESIEFFRQRGVDSIVLNTQSDNERAQRLYRWFGFRPMGLAGVVLEKKVLGPG